MFPIRKSFLFGPPAGVPWAEKMVLNPAMTADPDEPGVLHMLFRATGPAPEAKQPGLPLPYPIFIGYAVSRDNGATWACDYSRPALAPALKTELADLELTDAFGRKMFHYYNGCIEDPRLFPFEGKLYLSVACRAFSPGPYWEHDDPVQCMPVALRREAARFGKAVAENTTVTLLFEVDLAALKARRYEAAFRFVTPLHQPDKSDDRDVMLFPRRLEINGRKRIVCLHRPQKPGRYAEGAGCKAPSIFLALADELSDFYAGRAEEVVFAEPVYGWEADRIGASFAPVELERGLWLLPYHGKQDATVGYTQSYMLLRENGMIPAITARPAERMLYATEPWELEGDFTTPCVFSCAGVREGDEYLISYGAADSKVGLARMKFKDLVEYLKKQEA